MKKATVLYFWCHKFKKMGFAPDIADLFGFSVAHESQWRKERQPDTLPAYLRKQAKREPHEIEKRPFDEIRRQKKTLPELLGRKSPPE